MILYRDLASRVALVMAPLLPRIRRGVENMGLGKRGGEKMQLILSLLPLKPTWH